MDENFKNMYNLVIRITSAIIFAALSVAMLVIGVMYLDDCPANSLIPIYMVVAGSAQIIIIPLILIPVFAYCCCRERTDALACVSMCVLVICMAFSFAWHIAGSVWVFGLEEDDWNSKNSTADNFCHPTVYYFAFWQLLASYIIVGLEILITCCIMCCAACSRR